MNPRFRLLKKYFTYHFNASNSRGHGVHSPFVFDFITNILLDKRKYESYTIIEAIRADMLQNTEGIMVEDFGAGSIVQPSSLRTVRTIARSSLKNSKFSQLLYRIVQYYKPSTIVELGTSLGITTCYLASGNPASQVFTFEGSKNIASIAINNFNIHQFENIELIVGNFDDTLKDTIKKLESIGLAFIDGNHRKIPTLQYFHLLLKAATPDAIFIFDDIHWSDGMEEAWQEIKEHSAVTLSIDLFFVGLVFFSPQFKAKQHFTIRF